MKHLAIKSNRRSGSGIASLLAKPLSNWWCAIGWIVSSGVFVTITQLLRGPTSADSGESINTAWAISHGFLSCAYPPANQYGLPYMAPLYPLLSSAGSFLVTDWRWGSVSLQRRFRSPLFYGDLRNV